MATRQVSCLAILAVVLGDWSGIQPSAIAQSSPKPVEPVRPNAIGDALPPGAILRLGTTRLRHSSAVTCVAVDRNGKYILSGGMDYKVRLWKCDSGALIHEWQCECIPSSVQFHPTKPQALLTSDAVELWDLTDFKKVASFAQYRSSVVAAAIRPDGKVIASAQSTDRAIQLWDTVTGRQIPIENRPEIRTTALTFSSDGQYLVCGGDSEGQADQANPIMVLVWDVKSEKVVTRARWKSIAKIPVKRAITDVAMSLDRSRIIAVETGGLGIWDTESGRPVVQISQGGGTGVTICRDGRTFLTGVSNQGIDSGLIDKPEQRSLHLATAGPISSLATSADGKWHAASQYGNIYVWADGQRPLWPRPEQGHLRGVTSAARSPDGKWAATSDGEEVFLWELERGSVVRHVSFPILDASKQERAAVLGIAFSRDGSSFLVGTSEGIHRVTNPWGAVSTLISFGGKRPHSLAFSSDGRSVGIVRSPTLVRVWAINSPEKFIDLDLPAADALTGHECRSLAWEPEGEILAVGSLPSQIPGVNSPAKILFWEVASRKLKRSMTIPNGTIDYLRFSADGLRLMCVGATGHSRVGVWDSRSGKELAKVAQEHRDVVRAEFSPDGNMILTGHDDGIIRLWEVATGGECERWLGHNGPIGHLDCDRRGRTLFSGGSDGISLLWNVAPLIPELDGTRNDLRECLRDLTNADPRTAYRSQWALASNAEKSLGLIADFVIPIPPLDLEKVRDLIGKLDAPRFVDRQNAHRALKPLAPLCEEEFRRAFERSSSPEQRKHLTDLLRAVDDDGAKQIRIRDIRLIQVLEMINTAESRKMLVSLAAGEPNAHLTRQSKAALSRAKPE